MSQEEPSQPPLEQPIVTNPQDTLGTAPHRQASVAAERIYATDSATEAADKLRLHGMRIGWGLRAPWVFWPAVALLVAVVAAAIFAPAATGAFFTGIDRWIVANLGWYYVGLVGSLLAVVTYIAVSPLGQLRLARGEVAPAYSLPVWFGMLFSTGMGIGLVFYGVGEPLAYVTTSPKPGWDGDSADLARLGMAQTFIHWGLHPWAIYAMVGLAVAYAIHRRGRPVSIRWTLEPLLGDRVTGRLGDLIDVLAIVGTVFGVATSLGLGVQQLSAGMASLGIVDGASNLLLVAIITGITLVGVLSLVTGVGVGIKWLSNFNLSLAGVLLVTVLLLGPTVFIFQGLIEAIGAYLANFFGMSFDVGAYRQDDGAASWFSSWTMYYWGWWISWSPLVGLFIARISFGRTVREFIFGVLLVPTAATWMWFATMGGLGLFEELFGGANLAESNLDSDGNLQLENMALAALRQLPAGMVWVVVALVLVVIFLVISSDSGSLVLDMLSTGGHPNPPVWSRIVFAVLEGALAVTLLIVGGLGALQSAAIATALPFSVVIIAMGWATVRALRRDLRMQRTAAGRRHRADIVQQATAQVQGAIDDEVEPGPAVDRQLDYDIEAGRGIFHRDRE